MKEDVGGKTHLVGRHMKGFDLMLILPCLGWRRDYVLDYIYFIFHYREVIAA